jgi:hypothetical protein
MVISLYVLLVVFHSPVSGPVDHQAKGEYGGSYAPGINSAGLRFVGIRPTPRT